MTRNQVWVALGLGAVLLGGTAYLVVAARGQARELVRLQEQLTATQRAQAVADAAAAADQARRARQDSVTTALLVKAANAVALADRQRQTIDSLLDHPPTLVTASDSSAYWHGLYERRTQENTSLRAAYATAMAANAQLQWDRDSTRLVLDDLRRTSTATIAAQGRLIASLSRAPPAVSSRGVLLGMLAVMVYEVAH